jgi:hypothetical protein
MYDKLGFTRGPAAVSRRNQHANSRRPVTEPLCCQRFRSLSCFSFVFSFTNESSLEILDSSLKKNEFI